MIDRRYLVGAVVVVSLLAGCGGGPSKSQALEAIKSGVKEDGACTLPVDILARVKMQHATKGVCVPKEGADKAKACIEALVAANVTRRMPEAYMVAWPDEVSSASLADIPAYERRARNLVYTMCVELSPQLREGRFTCAEARAESVLKVSTVDATHAEVRYARELTFTPSLAAIDAACGSVTRPPGESTVAFVKDASLWTLASAPPDTSAH